MHDTRDSMLRRSPVLQIALDQVLQDDQISDRSGVSCESSDKVPDRCELPLACVVDLTLHNEDRTR